MAEQAAGAVASAVIGGITDRTLSTVVRKLQSGSRTVATHEKLQRLETLVLKLRCAVEVSEKHAIGSAWLLELRDRLREAAAESGAVVLDLQRRSSEEENGDAAAATSVPGQQQPAGALYFTRSALCGLAQPQRVRDATRSLLSTDEDMERLDGTLEQMERLTPDIKQLLFCLANRSVFKRVIRMVSSSEITQLAREDREREARLLVRMLERTLRRIDGYISVTDERDMEGLECLAEWAAVRREAVERGNVVLQTLRASSEEEDGAALEEDGELYSFVRAVHRLAGEEQSFACLVDLCPMKH